MNPRHIHRLLARGLGVALLLLPAATGAQTATGVWESGFEAGFPGEFLDYPNGYSESGADIPGSASSWTIIDDPSDGPIFADDHGYRGRVVASSGDLHRAYPVLHTDVPSPYVNSWMVYLDVDYASLSPTDWISVGTWAHKDVGGVWSELATVSLRDRHLEMAHANWTYVGPAPQPEFPTQQWVRLTTYIDRSSGNELAVWQDGVLVFRGSFPEPIDGTALLRAHWGLYGTGTISDATLYNDSMQLWTLSGPLASFDDEPLSPYGPYTDGGPGGSGPGSGKCALWAPTGGAAGAAELSLGALVVAALVGLAHRRRSRRRLRDATAAESPRTL